MPAKRTVYVSQYPAQIKMAPGDPVHVQPNCGPSMSVSSHTMINRALWWPINVSGPHPRMKDNNIEAKEPSRSLVSHSNRRTNKRTSSGGKIYHIKGQKNKRKGEFPSGLRKSSHFAEDPIIQRSNPQRMHFFAFQGVSFFSFKPPPTVRKRIFWGAGM